MAILDPVQWHQEQEQQFTAERQALAARKNRTGWIRVAVFAAGVLLTWNSWSASIGLAFLVFAAALAVFLWLLSRSLDLAGRIAVLEQLIAIHREEQEIARHRFLERYSGLDQAPRQHDYAGDLDIFGQASLFQYLHRSTSQQGHRALAQALLAPADTGTILLRQKAVREIGAAPEWSAAFQAAGTGSPLTLMTEKRIQHWQDSSNRFYPNRAWKLVATGFPVISLGTLALHLAGVLPANIFYLLVLVFLVVAFRITKLVTPQYRMLDKVVPELKTLSHSLEQIEKAPFTSAKLAAIRDRLSGANQATASASIRHLSRILDRFDYRLNPLVFIPVNTFLLWDLQQVLALEKWKSTTGMHIAQWFEALAETELLNSLGRAAFNHPGWTYPVLTDEAGTYIAQELGHPLIPADKRVDNDFSTTGRPAIALITGSNMAGKSTFLRSVGVNQVLAMAGSAVCAGSLTVSTMRIMSSMRIADNLEENTSTFYAELSKLKSIIEAVNGHEPVFLLLDEILRGTNSHDRHTGSRALIRQLVKQDACGMLATHDLALTSLSEEMPGALTNYHFDVSVEGEELYFDYLLKPGVCQSLNASILMKKIGINL